MKRGAKRIVFLFACAVWLGVSAWAQKVNTKFDENYDFSEHKNYKWREKPVDDTAESGHELHDGPENRAECE